MAYWRSQTVEVVAGGSPSIPRVVEVVAEWAAWFALPMTHSGGLAVDGVVLVEALKNMQTHVQLHVQLASILIPSLLFCPCSAVQIAAFCQ